MGFSIETSVSAVTVFLQGALSFFSPCVLPLVPLYVSYLAGGAAVVGEDGVRRYPRGKIFLNTLFFVVGISFAFFLLGLGLTALGEFFHNYQVWFARASGVIILLFGLYQLGLGKRTMLLEQEHRLPFHLNKLAMNPAVAPGDGLHLQLRLDALRGPHPQQRPADGLLRRVLRCGISADRRVHPGLRTALPGSGTLHRHGAGFLQVPPECGALHGEDRRGAADRHGHPDPHRRHRRHLRRSGCRLRHGAGRARREQRRRGGPLRRFLKRSTAGRTARRSPWSPLRTSP